MGPFEKHRKTCYGLVKLGRKKGMDIELDEVGEDSFAISVNGKTRFFHSWIFLAGWLESYLSSPKSPIP